MKTVCFRVDGHPPASSGEIASKTGNITMLEEDCENVRQEHLFITDVPQQTSHRLKSRYRVTAFARQRHKYDTMTHIFSSKNCSDLLVLPFEMARTTNIWERRE